MFPWPPSNYYQQHQQQQQQHLNEEQEYRQHHQQQKQFFAGQRIVNSNVRQYNSSFDNCPPPHHPTINDYFHPQQRDNGSYFGESGNNLVCKISNLGTNPYHLHQQQPYFPEQYYNYQTSQSHPHFPQNRPSYINNPPFIAQFNNQFPSKFPSQPSTLLQHRQENNVNHVNNATINNNNNYSVSSQNNNNFFHSFYQKNKIDPNRNDQRNDSDTTPLHCPIPKRVVIPNISDTVTTFWPQSQNDGSRSFTPSKLATKLTDTDNDSNDNDNNFESNKDLIVETDDTNDHEENDSTSKTDMKVPSKWCSNCGATSTSSWRRDPSRRFLLCNACGLHLRIHGKNRKSTQNQQKLVCQYEKMASVRGANGKNRNPQRNLVIGRCFTACAHCSTKNTKFWRKGKFLEDLCDTCGDHLARTGTYPSKSISIPTVQQKNHSPTFSLSDRKLGPKLPFQTNQFLPRTTECDSGKHSTSMMSDFSDLSNSNSNSSFSSLVQAATSLCNVILPPSKSTETETGKTISNSSSPKKSSIIL